MRSFHPVAPAAELPVWLFENHGPTRFFCTRQALAQWLGHAHLRDLAPSLRSARPVVGLFLPLIVEHRWVARQGDTVLCWADLNPLLVSFTSKKAGVQSYEVSHRCQPVPDTGKSRSGRYRTLIRFPRTLQLLREARFAAHEPEADVPALRSRLRCHPTSWDDQIRSDCSLRSWKHRRDHQWK